MKLSPEEVTSVIKQRIAEYGDKLDVTEVGIVLQVGDGIARVYGVSSAMYMELLEFPGGVMGMPDKMVDSGMFDQPGMMGMSDMSMGHQEHTMGHGEHADSDDSKMQSGKEPVRHGQEMPD